MILEWLPNIHPLLIHFPIVLLPLAVLAHVLSLILKQQDQWEIPVGILYTLGAGGALVSYLSGKKAAETVDVLPMANPVLSSHADLALWTLVIFGIVTIIYWLFQRLKVGRLFHSLLVSVALFGIGLLIVTADRGGQLVYRFGTGVSLPVENENDSQLVTTESALIENADGSWIWAPQKEGKDRFSGFRFIEGNGENIQAGPERMREYMIEKPVTFIFDNPVADVQVDVKLNVSAFEGAVFILHHFQSLGQYDFLKLSSGEMSLGRVQNGKHIDMDTKSAAVKEGVEFRVVGSGRHFRGYMDNKLIVHGHEPPLKPGAVGLRIDGKGIIELSSIHTIPIKN